MNDYTGDVCNFVVFEVTDVLKGNGHINGLFQIDWEQKADDQNAILSELDADNIIR